MGVFLYMTQKYDHIIKLVHQVTSVVATLSCIYSTHVLVKQTKQLKSVLLFNISYIIC